jgi:2-polyprenyl-3-methyl-5-hydroxy-6-metoxy-1,4-benzoquinol methylase
MRDKDVNGRSEIREWPAGSLEVLGHCPLCGNTARTQLHADLEDRLFFSAPGSWMLYACAACGAAYLDPRPARSAIHLAYSNYFTHHERMDDDPASPGTGRFASLKGKVLRQYLRLRFGPICDPFRNALGFAVFLRPRLRVAFDSAMRHLPRPGTGHTLLDIGCGSGRFLAWARAAGWICAGTEVDPLAAARAAARGFAVHLGDAAELAASGRKFHAVTISHVIEHVHEPLALLRAARQLLHPGGLLWIETPNLASHGHHCFGRFWRDLDPPRHLQIFHHALLHRLLAEAGFVQIEFAPWQLDWAATSKTSFQLAGPDVSPKLRADPVVRNGEAVGRDNPFKREFITLIARGAAESPAPRLPIQ